MGCTAKSRHREKLTEAQASLVADNRKLPLWFARRMTANRPWVLEGASDAAIDALIRAARDYSPVSRAKFVTFAGIYIYRAILCHFKFLRRNCRRPPGDLVSSLDATGDFDDLLPTFPPRLADDDEGFEDLLTSLPGDLAAVLRARFVGGLTQQQIGDSLGVTQQRAQQLERQAIRLLRDHHAGDDPPGTARGRA